MSIGSDFAGLAGLTISTAGTVMLAGELGRTIRSASRSSRRTYKSKSHKSRGKRK